LIVELAEAKKAKDIEILELKHLTIITDYFIICSGERVRTIVDYIEEELKKRGIRPASIEGYNFSKWVLMDYSDVIVHVFEEQTREYYQIENLWIDAPRIEFEKDQDILDR